LHRAVCSEKGFQKKAKQFIRHILEQEVDGIEELCKSGINVNFYFSENFGEKAQNFPLVLALTNGGSVPIIKMLIKYGADVNKRVVPNGNTCLHVACVSLQTEAALALLEAPGIDVNAKKYSTGASPIHMCCGIGVLGISGLPHPRQDEYAVVMKRLLELGANPNAVGHDIKSAGTPLMYAAAAKNPKLVKLLLEYGGDSTVIDNTGKNAAAYAAGNMEIVNLLKNLRKK